MERSPSREVNCNLASQVRSDQVALLLTVSQSVCPSWPRAPNCDSWSYFSLEENCDTVFRGASTLKSGRSFHVQGLVFVCVVCTFILKCGCRSRSDIIIIIIMYKFICTCQACQSGQCAAHYTNLICLWQFRHL